jgi:CheY-like chemotaxis protein
MDSAFHAGVALSGVSPAQRVLIVDDNVEPARLLADELRAHGYETRVAEDALDALLLAASFEPDVAILDLRLPGMDGYELARSLRARPHLGACKFIALTGYAVDAGSWQSREARFYKHLTKPVNLNALLSAIAEHAPSSAEKAQVAGCSVEDQ